MAASDEYILQEIADEFTARIRAGETPAIESYAEQHPELSEDIAIMLSSIELLEQLSQRESDSREQANSRNVPTPKIEKLGEFDIVREIGRGGMGVVYEALDSTLQRRVALKVLNDTALLTQKNIDRFQRESRLAAQLHHTNIVSVFGVGEDDGKHFYAMQYVEGVSVHDILEGLQSLHGADHKNKTIHPSAVDGVSVAAALRDGQFASSRNPCHIDPSHITDDIGTISKAAAVKPTDRGSTDNGATLETHTSVSLPSDVNASNSPRSASQNGKSDPTVRPRIQQLSADRSFGHPYWQSVARIGVQVAEALQYAHVNGVLHRDIKPANLLFDANGTAWVADFGLAKPTDTDDLTKTGDVVGTLKYMAPEQMSGKSDTRTDIYGLGQTLYELLTLRPVCDGQTYNALLSQKKDATHITPRKVNPTIPRDLETIVQKTLACEPDKRYASARELSDDLQRFIDDEPIQARRVSLGERVWRWCRRNRPLAILGAMVACLMILLPSVLGWAYVSQSNQNDRMKDTIDVVMDGFDELFGSYLDDDVAAANALSESPADAQLAPAMLTKDTANVLEKMLVVYDRLAEVNASTTNMGLATESAKARRRVGDLYQQLGQFAKASEAYEDAIERYVSLSTYDSKHQIELARVHRAMGTLHQQSQDFELANAAYQKSIATLENVPSSAEVTFELGWTHYLLGKQHVADGPPPLQRHPNSHRAAKIVHLDSAIELARELRTTEENNAAYRFLLALSIREKERAGVSTVPPEGNSTDILKKLVKQFPTIPRYRYELCETYRSAYRYSNNVDQGDRLEMLHLANELGEELVHEQRDSAPYRILLAHTYAYLGMAYRELNDIKHAEAFTRMSIVTHEAITDEFPGLASLSARLSMNDKSRLGEWLLQLQRYEELIELVQPLGETFLSQLEATTADDDLRQVIQARLRRCGNMLLPAFKALDDNVGYLIALDWVDQAKDGRGRQGNFPPVFPPGPPSNMFREEMVLSYDDNNDGQITRDEVAPRMAREWFRRMDKDENGAIDRDELITSRK